MCTKPTFLGSALRGPPNQTHATTNTTGPARRYPVQVISGVLTCPVWWGSWGALEWMPCVYGGSGGPSGRPLHCVAGISGSAGSP